MDALDRLITRTGEADTSLLQDMLDTAEAAIMARRYPFGEMPDTMETRYQDLQFRIALDLYNKQGAEGETAHSEGGISRTFESSWISEQLLSEVTPKVGGLS